MGILWNLCVKGATQTCTTQAAWKKFVDMKCPKEYMNDSFTLPFLKSLHSDYFLLPNWFSQFIHVPLWPNAMRVSKHVKKDSKLFKHKMHGTVKVHSSADSQHLFLVFVSIAKPRLANSLHFIQRVIQDAIQWIKLPQAKVHGQLHDEGFHLAYIFYRFVPVGRVRDEKKWGGG